MNPHFTMDQDVYLLVDSSIAVGTFGFTRGQYFVLSDFLSFIVKLRYNEHVIVASPSKPQF